MSCVYCGSTDNLNTTFMISIDDQKIQVLICDEHAEEASVKTAKEAYVKRQKQIDDFLAQAKLLGLNVSINNGISIAAAAPAPQRAAAPAYAPALQMMPETMLDGDDVIDTQLIDNNRGMKSVGGSTNYGNVASYDSLSREMLTEKLDPQFFRGQAKVAMVEGRGGQPLAIQELRVDGTGTTRIQIFKMDDDSKLQNRFKRMADDSRNDRTPDFARSGYENTMRPCPLCKEETTIVNRGKVEMCPKCKGMGKISVY